MLVMSLSGIYLWWPRNAGFLRGLRWRRGPTLSFNLHHLLGFWIAIPLAVVSATGIYLGFPQQARDLLVVGRADDAAAARRLRRAAAARHRISMSIARSTSRAPGAAGARPRRSSCRPSRARPGACSFARPDSDELTTVLVDDRTGAASRVTPHSGDRIAQWIRWIHEGSHSGVLWQVVVFVCGLLPTVFAITGMMIWLRSRRVKAAERAASQRCRRSTRRSEESRPLAGHNVTV